jgi:ADP-ribose pyrophosphatase
MVFSMDEDREGVGDREVYAGRILTLRLAYVTGRDGRRHLRELVDHKPGAATVAVDDAGQVVLVRQPRPAVNAQPLELPAGLVDPGETPEVCAARELREETGYVASEVVPLVRFYTSPGFTDELIHIFAARGLKPGAAQHEDEEEIELVHMPLLEALDLVLEGEISDAKTVAGLLAYVRRYGDH